ncbi:MAG: 23S rRNA (pseudouridine(1915)-N(3))-methyltransferase RlmH [Clostridia bacterium]|nr:23S rRNA (pseudouridine(1915)-N(3))-methyltransferase RlmH [Clostridia bacterium]
MLTIEIIAVGKIKEKYLSDTIAEYSKRLGRYCNFKITQVLDFPDDENEIKREADLILPKISGVCVPLCVEGKQLSSEDFAKLISSFAISGTSHICFVIGGSNGLDNRIKDMGNFKLSFSKMTFPHQIMRVILSEQIYRAFKIINNEKYHK